MFSHKPVADGSPCPQMRSLLSHLSDGTLTGIGRWYAQKHTQQCPRCAAALSDLVVVQAQLGTMRETKETDQDDTIPVLSSVVREEIAVAMDRIDGEVTSVAG